MRDRSPVGAEAGVGKATSDARGMSMAQTANSTRMSGREAALARRAALSSQGKAGLRSSDRLRHTPVAQQPDPSVSQKHEPAAKPAKERGKPRVAQQTQRLNNPTRAAALARRQAQSTRGKAGLNGGSVSAAQTARALNPQLSGRELARALRAQRSQRGRAGQQKSQPSGRSRLPKGGAAQDAPWKVGASETSSGQTVTGTPVGRSRKTTGDEPSTCRSVTGTEYLGAEIFREFCQSEPTPGPRKVRQSPTSGGNRVTGNEVGRSPRVTGDEPGTCQRVTGTEYVGADQPVAYCGVTAEARPAKVGHSETRGGKPVTGVQVGRSAKVSGDEPGAGRELTGSQYMKAGNGPYPPKVGSSRTLRGEAVTGTLTGRSSKVTGDEPGSCRAITGDEYISQEQYAEFCAATPGPQDAKVGLTQTLKGQAVTGTLTGRSGKVTGDEPGTCKAITGTPYAGAEQYRSYCEPAEAKPVRAGARSRSSGEGMKRGSWITGSGWARAGRNTGIRKP